MQRGAPLPGLRFSLLLLIPAILSAAPTSVTLSSSSNPAVLGHPLILTAAVTPSAATGSITFYDGTTVLETEPVSNGQAIFTTVLLASGMRSLKAYYAGNGTYAGSTSPVLAESVTAVAVSGYQTGAVTWGNDPVYAIAEGDFNGDGKPDLVVGGGLGSVAGPYLYVALGNGDGTFQPAVSYAVSEVYSLAVADFNGDGKQDLAVGDEAGIVIFLGNGDGTFQMASTYTYGGLVPASIAVADFNGDGNADLVEANGTAFVLLGNGDGTFRSAVSYPVGESPSAVVTGDFNGDGKADIAVANSASDNVSILLGKGDGTFHPAVNYGASVYPSSIALADFNGDAKADLVVGNKGAGNSNDGFASVLIGNGDGSFKPPVNYIAGVNVSSVAVGDFNGDGKTDFAVANYSSNTVSILLGNGDGTFQKGVNYAGGTGPEQIAAVDWNGDGRTDLAIVGSCALFCGTTVSLLLGEGPQATTTLVSSLNPSALGQSVSLTATISPSTASGSVTFYDGTAVLGTAALAGGEAVFTSSLLAAGPRALEAHYNGSFSNAGSLSPIVDQTVNTVPAVTFAPIVNYSAGGDADAVAVGDFNGDGKADLAVANGDSVSILLGNGDGTFTAPVIYPAGFETTSIVVADFNGDGKQDLALSNGVAVLLGNGDGTFQPAVNYPNATITGPAAVGDFNGDGKPDLVVTGGLDDIDVLMGNGDGTFQAPVGYDTYSFGDSFSVAIGDFNGDGKPDLAVATSSSGANYTGSIDIFLGNGDGTFQPPVSYGNGSNYTWVTVGDFNNDGKLDLIGFADSLVVFLGNGDGTFRPQTSIDPGLYAYAAAVGDLNGDGNADLFIANSNSGVSVLLGNGNGTFQAAKSYNIGSTPASIAVGDFNGDGRTDLAVADNTLSVLLGAVVNPTTTTLASSPNPSSFGQNVTLTATVSPATATGTVTFYHGSTAMGTGPVNGGVATLPVSTLSVGLHSLTATYSGDSYDLTSTSHAITQTVNQASTTTGLASSPNPSSVGQNVTLTATVSPATSTGTVTFYRGSTSMGTSPLTGGTATLVVSTLTFGSHSLTATYNGDMNDATSTSPSLIQVVENSTTTLLSSSPNPSILGQSVTLTATVSPATATGTVTFYRGSTSMGTGNLSGGVATLPVSTLSLGAHSLTATYNGDANDQPSTSPALIQQVKNSTTTLLTSSPNPSNQNQTVTLTATVTPATATGTVTFYHGSTEMGTGTLSGGIATFATFTLSPGTHSLTATYGGDANDAPSTSAAVNQVVK